MSEEAEAQVRRVADVLAAAIGLVVACQAAHVEVRLAGPGGPYVTVQRDEGRIHCTVEDLL